MKYILGAFNFIALALGMIVIYVLVFDGLSNRDTSVSVVNKARGFIGKPPLKIATISCMPQDIEGSTFVFDYPVLHSQNTKMVQLELSNQLRNKSILLHLNAPDDRNRRIVSSLIPSMGSVTVTVPAEKYSVSFDMGNNFCNLNRGFLGNQKKIGIRQPINLETKSYATLNIDDGAVSNGGLKISLNETDSAMNAVSLTKSDAFLSVPMSLDGHFYVSAKSNHFPFVFMVDSGATNVAFPAHFIKNLGVKRCSPVTTNTANGIAKGCEAMVKEITFGPYTINNVKVVFLKRLNTPLLGMNVLNKFKMFKVDDELELVKKGG